MKSLSQFIKAFGSKLAEAMDELARDQAGKLRDDIVVGWPVEKGASRAGWEGPTQVAFAHYRVSNNYVYSPVIEYGGYPGVGPKTEEVSAHELPGGIDVNQGIYPTQRPAAPVRRAISKRTLELEREMNKVIKGLI